MIDREKVIKGLECAIGIRGVKDCDSCPYDYEFNCLGCDIVMRDAIKLLKEQDRVLQKMWNALYAEEDKLEKTFVGTDEHDNWFTVYRPWLQRGFEIGLRVIAKQEEGEVG